MASAILGVSLHRGAIREPPSAQGKCPNGQTAIRTLHSLLVPLRGQIALDLRARTSVSGGKLVTTFPTVPDAAVSGSR